MCETSVNCLDPFCHVSFLNVSQATEKIVQSLCPTWDQTLIFDNVEIDGQPKDVAREPPDIVLEIFDHDTFVSSFHFADF